VRLTWTGPGRSQAIAGIGRLGPELAAESRRLVLIGVAGGLDPSLRRGDVVAIERVLRWETDPALAAPLERRLGGPSGGVALTVDRIVASAADKGALWSRLGRPASAVVDMETFHWLAALGEGAAPRVLRAVSDPAGLSLPAFLAGCVGAGGEISRARVARGALVRPWTAPSLLRLQRDVRFAAQRLADAVETIAQQGEEW
jgi:hypothetical protein